MVLKEGINDKRMILSENNSPKIGCALFMLMFVCSAARMNEEETERTFARHFILPGKVIRIEWLKSSSLDENIIKTSTVKIIPVLKNNFAIISFCNIIIRNNKFLVASVKKNITKYYIIFAYTN